MSCLRLSFAQKHHLWRIRYRRNSLLWSSDFPHENFAKFGCRQPSCWTIIGYPGASNHRGIMIKLPTYVDAFWVRTAFSDCWVSKFMSNVSIIIRKIHFLLTDVSGSQDKRTLKWSESLLLNPWWWSQLSSEQYSFVICQPIVHFLLYISALI